MRTYLTIRCSCGRRIFRKHILQISFHYKLLGRSYVAIKYKCPRCKRIGEYFVDEKRWDASYLTGQKGELTPQEMRRFQKLGKITIDEMLDFHLQLKRNKNWIKDLIK